MKAIAGALSALKSGEGLKGQLMRGGVGSVAIKLGSTVLNVVLAIVLARALGAEGFGVYSFVFALVTILAIPAQMGLPNLVVRETAKAQANGDWALMKGLWRWSSLMALAMSAALIALGALAAWIFADRLPEGGLAVFYWGLVLVPLVALGNLRGAALRGLRHVVQGQLPEFILRPAFLIVLVLAMHLAFSARALTASDAMMLHAVASLVAFGIGVWLLVQARPGKLIAEPRSTTHPNLWFRSALPLGLAEGMQLINANVGLIALGIFASVEDVGLFRVALQGAALVAFGLTAVDLVAAPHIAHLYNQKQLGRLQHLLTLSARASLFLALPVAVIFVSFGAEILGFLFGDEFGTAYWPMSLFIFAQVVNAFAGPVGILLTMTGYERDVAIGVALSLATNLLLSSLLIPLLGLNGAAIAGAVAIIVWNASLVYSAYRRLGVSSLAFGSR